MIEKTKCSAFVSSSNFYSLEQKQKKTLDSFIVHIFEHKENKNLIFLFDEQCINEKTSK